MMLLRDYNQSINQSHNHTHIVFTSTMIHTPHAYTTHIHETRSPSYVIYHNHHRDRSRFSPSQFEMASRTGRSARVKRHFSASTSSSAVPRRWTPTSPTHVVSSLSVKLLILVTTVFVTLVYVILVRNASRNESLANGSHSKVVLDEEDKDRREGKAMDMLGLKLSGFQTVRVCTCSLPAMFSFLSLELVVVVCDCSNTRFHDTETERLRRRRTSLSLCVCVHERIRV